LKYILNPKNKDYQNNHCGKKFFQPKFGSNMDKDNMDMDNWRKFVDSRPF